MADAATPPGIEREPVERFFARHVPEGQGPLHFTLIGDGRSNLTYRVEGPGGAWVLRRPPLGHVLPTAHDMGREFRVLRALSGSEVPVPTAIALCEDDAVTGAAFYVMEHRPGVVLAQGLPDGYATTSDERRRIGDALVDTLVALHAVDYLALGLADFGRPDGYLERQVRRWSKQWERSKTRPIPEIDELQRRLAREVPVSADATIVHGDFRLGNMALDPADPGRVLAVYDWEMATLGDPLADLGYTLIYWAEAGDNPSALHDALTAQSGFVSRDELCAAYAGRSGRNLGRIDFYRVLALYKLAVITEGIYARFQMGKTVGQGFERAGEQTGRLARRALAIAESSTDASLR